MLFKNWLINLLEVKTLLIFVLAFSASGQSSVNNQLKFNVPQRNQIGLNTIQTRYADLDGDGFLDVVAVNGGEENPNPKITILFGTGNGGFSTPFVFPSYLIGHTLAIGDLNNDGKPDLVVAGWYQNAIGVFLNQGNRQFASPVISIPPDPPNPGFPYGEFFDLAIADFDGDGNVDVVALQDQINQRLRFFHYSGQGTLTVFRTLDQIGQNTSYEREMAIGDLNGDNRADIVLAGGGPFGTRHMSFVFGQPPGGTLSLSYGFNVEDKAVGIAVKDLDNDGDNDMAVAFLDTTTPTRHSLQTFRNNGSGVFAAIPKVFLEYPFPPDDITAADFNNDGKQDLAVLIGSVYNAGVMVLITNGTGDCTFSGEKYYAVSGSTSIASADLNQDNKIDLITASSYGSPQNMVSVVFNDNSQKFKAPLVTLWGPNFIDYGDFNSDGYNDLATAWATDFYTSGVDILINDTEGGLLPEVRQESPAYLNGMQTGDFNGDGKRDALSSHRGGVLSVYIGNGQGTLAPPVNTLLNRGFLYFTVGDFNSDGKDDVFGIDDQANGYTMLSDGTGLLSSSGAPITLPSNVPFRLQKGDFNRDGKLDLIISMNSDVKLWLGNGTGGFTQSQAIIPAMTNVVTGDFNGDGKLDVAGTVSNGITGILGDGNGGFTTSFTKFIGGIYSIGLTKSVVTADFDLDGFDDVAMIMESNSIGNLIIIPSNGAIPSWKDPVFYGVGAATKALVAQDFNADGKTDLGYLGDNARGIIYNITASPRNSNFDFDGDGKADISVFRPSNGAWYLLQSQKGFTGNIFGVSTDQLAPADYDGDGKTDIGVFRNGIWYYLRSSNNSFSALAFGQAGDVPRPGDFDSDGKADLTVFRPSNGAWYRLNSSDNSFFGTFFGQNGDKPLVADFDGDGKNDIAVFRPANATFYWLESSTEAFRAANFGLSTDIPTPGDYDGDGKTDIAVFRPSNGAWYRTNSSDGSFFATIFGLNGDIPTAADYDGDGKADIGVFRPSNGSWYYQQSSNGGFFGQGFGISTDKPVPAAFQN